jgi:stage III sporulation protein AA
MALLDELIVKKEVISYLSPPIRELFCCLKKDVYAQLEEIRLRCAQPVLLKIGDKDFSIDEQGQMNSSINRGYRVSEDDIYRTVAAISDNSLYAFEEDIKRGFITVPGGHRVGLAGQVVMKGHEICNIKDFSGLCFRIAREVRDCARPLLHHICDSKKCRVKNTLIVSAPRCGKTTILRDIARLLSNGDISRACNIVVVDERSEIAGSFRGIPQLDLGPRTDVLDSCPKALGMIIAVRALSPQVIITDEIGRKEDVEAIQECVNAGVAVVSSIHAGNLEELQKKPLLKELLSMGIFQCAIFLSRRKGPGTVEEIIRWD